MFDLTISLTLFFLFYLSDTCANVGHAKRLLGYSSSVSFEEGIKKTVSWYNSPNAVIARDSEELFNISIDDSKRIDKISASSRESTSNFDSHKRRRLSIEIPENDIFYPTDGTYYPMF